MDVYVIHTRVNGNNAPIGVFTSLEKAEEEADSHTASVYGITKVIQTTSRDGLEIRCYGEGEMHLINYVILRFELDAEPKRPEPQGF